MRVLGFVAIFVLSTTTVRAGNLSLEQPKTNGSTHTVSIVNGKAKALESDDGALNHSYSDSKRHCTTCYQKHYGSRHYQARRADHCGSIAGFPGGCGDGPGCCGNLWNTYCQDRKPCWTPGSRRYPMKVYVPVMGCGPYGPCGGSVKKPGFSSYLRRVPRIPAPHLDMSHFSGLFMHLTGHIKCDDGCVPVDRLEDSTLQAPQPADIHVEDDDAVPAPSPAESVERSFLPFKITSPKIGNANLQERQPFSLPFAR